MLRKLNQLITTKLSGTDYVVRLTPTTEGGGEISVSKTVLVKVEETEKDDEEEEEDDTKEVMVSWGHADEALGSSLLGMVQTMDL